MKGRFLKYLIKVSLILIFFNLAFNIRLIRFYNNPITLTNAAKVADRSLKDLIDDVKSKICVYCTKNINEYDKQLKYYLRLPCRCVICSKECFKNYFNLIFHKNKLNRNRKINSNNL
jgi:hypothetical protein